METTNRRLRGRKRSAINLTKHGFKFLVISLFSFNFFSGFAQQKSLDLQEWEQKLVVVNENIQRLDATILAINNRISSIPASNIDPSIQTRLSDLTIEKDQYVREKISIQALLISQNTDSNYQIQEIPMSTFSSLPQVNQEQILAHPERYKVIEN